MSGQSVRLMFGKGTVEVELGASVDATVIVKPPMAVIADPAAAVQASIVSPASDEGEPACVPLAEFAKGKTTACILICDITRPVPNGLLLPVLVKTLIEAGVPKEGITVLIATGLHRPNEGDELRELVGDEWVLDNVSCVNHFARNDEDHVQVGVTEGRGTVAKIDKRFVEAEVRIATGLVEPHFMAGYSGGRKVISPGIAHSETITTFHSARFMEHPKAVEGNLIGNPLHEEQLAIVDMMNTAENPILSMNVVIDDERRLGFVSYGHIKASHAQAVDFVRKFAEVGVPGPRFNTVVTSTAGYPLDKTYYQTVKGMCLALGVLAPGGDLIIASECSEGLGSEEFKESQARLVEMGSAKFLEKVLAQKYAEIDVSSNHPVTPQHPLFPPSYL
jgi:nickel-dependent lactate racemase